MIERTTDVVNRFGDQQSPVFWQGWNRAHPRVPEVLRNIDLMVVGDLFRLRSQELTHFMAECLDVHLAAIQFLPPAGSRINLAHH
jgi:hypothetical protein